MKFLIAGGYDTQNLGDYASFLGLYKLIKSENPEAQFTVLSRHPNDLFSQQFDVRTIINLDHANKNESLERFFRGFNEDDTNEHLLKIIQELINCDCLLIGNGRLFIDIAIGYMYGPLNYFATLILLARFLNKPVVLISVSLVEPSTNIGKQILKFIIQNSTLIIVREESSSKIAKMYTKKNDKVKILPDIAFAITDKDASFKDIPDVFNDGIGINFRGVNYNKDLNKALVKKNVEKVINLIDATDRNIVFCHQSTYDVDSELTDDRYVNKTIFDLLPKFYKERCHIFNNRWSLAQTLGQYSKLAHLFTERRHGFILSLTQSTSSTLICNEENTEIVKETIPNQIFYISDSEELLINNISTPNFDKILKNIRLDLPKYHDLLKHVITESKHD